ncbi:MAG TPA: hypothetical protein VKU94_07235 [Geobacterales bacterium]|nr:hypothetical protein [Geobacterales bacterium]
METKILITGFEELDKYLAEDDIIEFYSEQSIALDIIYHRVLALLAPVNLIIVGVRGGFDPLIFRTFCRIFNRNNVNLYIQRAFKAEDIEPTLLESKNSLPLVIYNPYGYRRLYARIVSAIKNSRSKVLIFSPIDRKKNGSTLGAHVAHSIIELKEAKNGIKARIIKSVTTGPITFEFTKGMIYYNLRQKSLLDWI